MKKRIIGLVLACVMMLTLLPTVAFAGTSTLKVTANKTTVKSGDTVTFTVSIGAVENLGSIDFVLDIPTGMTYVANSGQVANNLKDTLGAAAADWTESTKKFTVYGDGAYTSSKDTVLLTFNCIVNASVTPGSMRVSITEVSMSDNEFEPIDNTVTAATVSIPKPAITSVDVNVAAPVKGEAFATTAKVPSGAEYSVTSVSWFKGDNAVYGNAAPSTVYTVKVAVTAASGSTFAKNVTAANGFTVKRDSDTQLTLTKTFPATAAHDCVWATEWSHDANSHWYACTVSGCNLRKDEAKHSGGTATCTEKAVCSTCNVEYGNPLGHDLKKVAGTPATCTTDGTKEYWECDRCHDKFLDNKGMTAATEENTKIPAPGHKMVKTEAKDATCTATGNKEYYTCSVCKKLFTDEAGANETTIADVTLGVLDHRVSKDYVVGDKQHWKFCLDCGAVGDVEDHDYGTTGVCKCGAMKDGKVKDDHKDHKGTTTIAFDANKHWYTCSDPDCAGHVGEANHSLTTKRTIVVNGKKYEVKECVCGYVTRVEVKNNTTGTTTGTNPNAKNPYEKNDTTKKDDGKKVESGKTFDAGIALYVGLSVLSVTGGALVIGKKKEF